MKICLSGINGSGKTTLSLFLKEYLQEKHNRKKVVCLHASRLREFPLMFFKLIIHSIRREDVVCDRYFFDFFVIVLRGFLFRNYFLAGVFIYLFYWITPFDMVIYLDCNYEDIKKRSMDAALFTEEDFKQRIWLYSVINQITKPNIVNTTLDIERSKYIISGLVNNYLTGKN
jgi:thymidylate kinase